MATLIITMGFGKGDSQMDDTVEVSLEGIDPLPASYDGQDYGRERGVIATFATPEDIDWGWIRRVSRLERLNRAGMDIRVMFV